MMLNQSSMSIVCSLSFYFNHLLSLAIKQGKAQYDVSICNFKSFFFFLNLSEVFYFASLLWFYSSGTLYLYITIFYHLCICHFLKFFKKSFFPLILKIPFSPAIVQPISWNVFFFQTVSFYSCLISQRIFYFQFFLSSSTQILSFNNLIYVLFSYSMSSS